MNKTLRRDRIRKSAELPFLTRSPEVRSKESNTMSHSNEPKKSQNNGGNIPSLENQFFPQNGLRGTVKREKFASLTTQHLRSRREINAAISENNASSTEFIRKIQNSWEKFKERYKCNGTVDKLTAMHTMNKLFAVYFAGTSQQFTGNDYGVSDGKPYICKEKLRPTSTEYTKEDLLMCNDSIINIKYDVEYKVWNNFSILYKNKMYDYTEYRVLNVGIKICNSTDNDVRSIWRLRNAWVKAIMHFKSCNKPITYTKVNRGKYTVLKNFSVLIQKTNQVIPKNDYGVLPGKLVIICD